MGILAKRLCFSWNNTRRSIKRWRRTCCYISTSGLIPYDGHFILHGKLTGKYRIFRSYFWFWILFQADASLLQQSQTRKPSNKPPSNSKAYTKFDFDKIDPIEKNVLRLSFFFKFLWKTNFNFLYRGMMIADQKLVRQRKRIQLTAATSLHRKPNMMSRLLHFWM